MVAPYQVSTHPPFLRPVDPTASVACAIPVLQKLPPDLVRQEQEGLLRLEPALGVAHDGVKFIKVFTQKRLCRGFVKLGIVEDELLN